MSNEDAPETIRSLIEKGGPFDDEDLAVIRDMEQLRADIAGTTEDDIRTLHAAIGVSITTWSSLEGFVVEIASSIIDVKSDVGGVIFYNFPFARMLDVIGEIIRVDDRFASLEQEWDKLSKLLFGLNDVRVRLAHHGLSSGKDIYDFPPDIAEFPVDELLPGLEPYQADSRKKWKKKKRMSFVETVGFVRRLKDAVAPTFDFLRKAHAIRMEPKRRLSARVKSLQETVRDYESRPTTKGE
ncbi:hypothetical protein [Bradyrhizobium sp. HKCCYLS20291]|uniref:hypothetical protein n=1 Tax=Bradyrhizobium sp. HKCCYLS20291 TaxID=3420766 RepID=UPI003EBC35B4